MCRKLLLSILLLSLILNSPSAFAKRTVGIIKSPYYNRHSHSYVQPYHNTYNRINNYHYKKRHSEHFKNLNTPYGYTLNRNWATDNGFENLQRLKSQREREAIAVHHAYKNQKSVFRRIGDYFSGQLTGFEPPISEEFLYEPNYSQGFSNTSSYSYGTNPLNYGYRTNSQGIGNSSSIRILD